MTQSLSKDLRECVVAAAMGGESCRSAALRFGVAVSSAVKWLQRYRATGLAAPGKLGGHRKRQLDQHLAFIMERIGLTPHLALHGVKGNLAERGIKVSHNAVVVVPATRGTAVQKNAIRP
jgi:transposase